MNELHCLDSEGKGLAATDQNKGVKVHLCFNQFLKITCLKGIFEADNSPPGGCFPQHRDVLIS